MPLKLLPDLTWPITSRQIEPLNESLVQLNLIEAGLNPQQQESLAVLFAIVDRWVKSKGKINYLGKDGHARLVTDATSFVGGTGIVTRRGDLSASHLALDYNDSQIRLKLAGLPPLPDRVDLLLELVTDFSNMPEKMTDQLGVLLDYLAKRPMPK